MVWGMVSHKITLRHCAVNRAINTIVPYIRGTYLLPGISVAGITIKGFKTAEIVQFPSGVHYTSLPLVCMLFCFLLRATILCCTARQSTLGPRTINDTQINLWPRGTTQV